MQDQIKESDWKIFRGLHEVAVERCYERYAAEMQYMIMDKSKPARERFHEVGELYTNRRRAIADIFDGLSRSKALIQLTLIREQKLATDSEMARFSAETRKYVDDLIAMRKSWAQLYSK